VDQRGWERALGVFLLGLAAAIASSGQTLTTTGDFDGPNGASPTARLVQGSDGNFYGTTSSGGTKGLGTVFKITAEGSLTTLYSFDGVTGSRPWGELVEGFDGNFFGTTLDGGSHHAGTVFKMSPAGGLTTLYNFCSKANCYDGEGPFAGLILGTDGNFYGTTHLGGGGTVFRITPQGALTTMHIFLGPDGANPTGSLLQADDGNFYGTTHYGGDESYGTVFQLTPKGKLTTLHKFTWFDGAHPQAGLIEGADGNFYGSTEGGGENNKGTIFRITRKGHLTSLSSFHNTTAGRYPFSGVIQGTDGNFYGTTQVGGIPNGVGSVFSITSGGILTTLYGFCSIGDCLDGSYPNGLMQATDGNFYGTTENGATSGSSSSFNGTVFQLSMGFAPFAKLFPASGKVGYTVEIIGQGLTGTTNVSFNGVEATFKVGSDTFLKAIVPAGASTGPVLVTTPKGVLSGNVNFRLRQ